MGVRRAVMPAQVSTSSNVGLTRRSAGKQELCVPILEPYSLCPYDWIDCECGSDGEPGGEGDDEGDGCEGDEGERARDEERGREGQRSTCCCSSRALPRGGHDSSWCEREGKSRLTDDRIRQVAEVETLSFVWVGRCRVYEMTSLVFRLLRPCPQSTAPNCRGLSPSRDTFRPLALRRACVLDGMEQRDTYSEGKLRPCGDVPQQPHSPFAARRRCRPRRRRRRRRRSPRPPSLRSLGEHEQCCGEQEAIATLSAGETVRLFRSLALPPRRRPTCLRCSTSSR